MAQNIYSRGQIVDVYRLSIAEQNALKEYLLRSDGRLRDGAMYTESEVRSAMTALRPNGPAYPRRGMQPFTLVPTSHEVRHPEPRVPAPVTTLEIISYGEIVRRFNPSEEEFYELVERLKEKRKLLTTGGYGYFLSDINRTLADIRRGLHHTPDALAGTRLQ